jgi:uncharacterized protein YheU (UPF0270 family)
VSDYLELPVAQLSEDALLGVIEEYITREGTDYGAEERTLEQKVDQVRRQLSSGRAVINYDPVTESCSIQLKDQ